VSNGTRLFALAALARASARGKLAALPRPISLALPRHVNRSCVISSRAILGGLQDFTTTTPELKFSVHAAEKGVLVILSNCPQCYNPCSGWNPTPIRIIKWIPES
jgi:hypothetical protein